MTPSLPLVPLLPEPILHSPPLNLAKGSTVAVVKRASAEHPTLYTDQAGEDEYVGAIITDNFGRARGGGETLYVEIGSYTVTAAGQEFEWEAVTGNSAVLDEDGKLPEAQLPDSVASVSAAYAAGELAANSEMVAAQVQSLQIGQLDREGMAALLAGNGHISKLYNGATDHLEDWADLTEVTFNHVKVAGNKLVTETSTSAPQAAKIPIEFEPAKGILFTARLYVGKATQFVGIGFAGSNNAPKTSSTDAFLVGIRSTGEMGYLVGTELGGSGQASFGNAGSKEIGEGEEFLVTGSVVGGQVSLAITRLKNGMTFKRNSGSIEEAAFGAAGGVKHLLAYTGDSLGGHSIGPVTVTNATTSPKVATNSIENVATQRRHIMVNAVVNALEDRRQLIIAPGNNPLIPAPLAVYCHNAGGTEVNSVQDERMVPFVNALAAAGFNIVMANAGGESWANDVCRADYVAAYEWARSIVATSGTVITGQSMGGQVTFNLLPRKEIPNVAGVLLVAPVTSLDDLYSNATYAAQIRTAFGIKEDGSDFDAKTAGYHPEDRAGWEFRGVPTMLVSSTEDNICHIANAEALVAKIAPYASASLVKSTGAHMDAAQFTKAVEVGIPFLKSVVAL